MVRELVRPSRLQILRQYKNLMKESKKLLIPNRRDWLIYRIRHDFRKALHEKEDDKVIDYFKLGEIHLDSIKIQVSNLNQLVNQPETPPPAPQIDYKEEDDEIDPYADKETKPKPTVVQNTLTEESEYYSITREVQKE